MRITKVTTRNGDSGKTGLARGGSVYKNEAIIHALGDIDELSSVIGVCNTACDDQSIVDQLKLIQNDLFDIGGQISLNQDGANIITETSITSLDNYIHHYNESLEPLEEFIIPGGDLFSSNLHVARAITRRAERTVVELYSENLENNNVVMYLNRLSDYLFVLSRFYNKNKDIPENTWQR
jgi:cob(I)alamin adenosyltransferase